VQLKIINIVFTVTVIWGGARRVNALQYFFYLIIVFWLLSSRGASKKENGVRVGDRGVCILRTGSKQSSPRS
jgi:hypothetical protein